MHDKKALLNVKQRPHQFLNAEKDQHNAPVSRENVVFGAVREQQRDLGVVAVRAQNLVGDLRHWSQPGPSCQHHNVPILVGFILKLLDGSLHLHLVANVQVGEEFGHGPWEHTNFDNLRRQQTWLATFRQTHTSRSLPTTHRLRTISPLTSHALADLPTKWVCTDARRTCRLRRRARGPGQRWTAASGAHVKIVSDDQTAQQNEVVTQNGKHADTRSTRTTSSPEGTSGDSKSNL